MDPNRKPATDRPPRARARGAAGLYVHLPFCASRCAYCTFATSTELDLMPRVMAALGREVAVLGSRGGRPLATLYLGGGTPSLVPVGLLADLVATIDRHFPRLPGAEVTLEANPDDVTAEKARAWAGLGVTRVSVGVQAFSDAALAMLNRRHDAAQASGAVATLQGAGFAVSVDLMLGLPGLGADEIRATTAELLRLRPGHVSVYLLEMDKPHALARLSERRPDLFPGADAAAAQYLAVGRTLVEAGYRHYEISNFALPSREARHNVRYWRRRPVLAAGLAAHGHSGRRRWANLDTLPAYLDAVEGGRPPRAWSRRLADDEVVKERVMLGLRLARGVTDDAIAACSEAAPAFAEGLEDFLALGLARRVGSGRVRLTPRGWLVSNELFARLW
ncbi:MAG: coproporphyrinogen-III oxidase family protein [Thermoanaerobaculaceae bacterium]|nr:coproporphyrinogen-III oxidase family protein [Thermoanaerobaculaceae bacterium]TAM44416.1 MAG: coproporphyrinogen III oxidase family protein [Acidobacteriota bacterium]